MTREIRESAADEAGTFAFAARLLREFPDSKVFALHGGLGAGKTRLAQGFALAMGITRAVPSPTFTIANEYRAPDGRLFLHFDLYRLGGEDEVADTGFQEMLDRAAVAAVEWPERAGALLPADAVHVRIEPGGSETSRRFTAAGPADRGRKDA